MKIVILPGLDGTGILSSSIRDQLISSHPVSILSYPSNLFQYDQLQNWIEDLLPEEDFILLAESFAGPLAIKIAEQGPFKLKGVVFAATFARRPRKLPAFLAHTLKFMPTGSAILARLLQPIVMGKWANNDFTNEFVNAMRMVPASTLSRRLIEIQKVDVVSKLAKIDVPILYLRATNDRLVPERMSKDFSATSAPICEVEGPHFLLQANATEAACRIITFAAQLG